MTRSRKAKLFTATLITVALSMATSAMAQTYDGEWRVQINADSAACGDGTTVSIDINNGQVGSNGIGLAASGRVGDAGNINVLLASGVKRAAGVGRLAGTSGSGKWHGMMCSGTWTAQRV